ncbi:MULTISPECIES: hypothetical protein [Pedobacter]|uniref:hypothetical protein n=1 Tax=Pedobacter TaxID=84567 RepID=UPI00210B0958|nr:MULTISPECIES: hypothetical protein [unclassified Pedobacter]
METNKAADSDKNKTPQPDSEHYDLEHPENLAMPKFNSATEKREGSGLPQVENMNDEQRNIDTDGSHDTDLPETDLGNDRSDDESEDEKIIRT